MHEFDDIEQKSWRDFLESSSQLLNILNRTLIERHGLKLADVMLLQLLATSRGGSVRMGDLSNALMLIPSRLTQQARRLEALGLIRRSASEGDRRGVVATITGDGLAQAKHALATYARFVRKNYLNPLSRQQMTALGDSSRRISSALKDTEPNAKY
ncbi:DNA-binding MarR family transcriptional regulator [Mycobacterium frederiksbergense]|uniref:DNA-binding MarR family transcriptional regulator n=1 Tax=Mycolicibacterium frederiksbergense TaxID=117567 RepID=A0ABT6L1S4_9MYCO|nr:MarR family transcriptional regulator [Mycolicibacterium frederiksbergense]MDH6196898.1 DNA-binding MarR family transcriptional regulator [Mycolicibacterium frederiksbergense]